MISSDTNDIIRVRWVRKVQYWDFPGALVAAQRSRRTRQIEQHRNGWEGELIVLKTARELLRVSYQIGDYSLIGSYLWHQVILRRKITKADLETDYFD